MEHAVDVFLSTHIKCHHTCYWINESYRYHWLCYLLIIWTILELEVLLWHSLTQFEAHQICWVGGLEFSLAWMVATVQNVQRVAKWRTLKYLFSPLLNNFLEFGLALGNGVSYSKNQSLETHSMAGHSTWQKINGKETFFRDLIKWSCIFCKLLSSGKLELISE